MDHVSTNTLLFGIRPCIIILCIGLIFEILTSLQSNAQIIPIPPPAPEIKRENNRDTIKSDNSPPHIEVLTTELRQGKNVIKVEITDESSIKSREVRYVHDGWIRSTDLVKDQNNIYKALVTVEPPSAVVVINAEDIYENKVSIAKLLSVTFPPDLFSQIWDFLNKDY